MSASSQRQIEERAVYHPYGNQANPPNNVDYNSKKTAYSHHEAQKPPLELRSLQREIFTGLKTSSAFKSEPQTGNEAQPE